MKNGVTLWLQQEEKAQSYNVLLNCCSTKRFQIFLGSTFWLFPQNIFRRRGTPLLNQQWDEKYFPGVWEYARYLRKCQVLAQSAFKNFLAQLFLTASPKHLLLVGNSPVRISKGCKIVMKDFWDFSHFGKFVFRKCKRPHFLSQKFWKYLMNLKIFS